MSTGKCFVIIVHYGPVGPTNNLLSQLSKSQLAPSKVVVIDHSKERYPKSVDNNTLVIRPENNAGYAAGINIGLGALAGLGALGEDIVVIMNNDLQIESVEISKIKTWWAGYQQSNPHFHRTIAGPRAGQVNFLTGRTGGRRGGIYLDGALLSAPYKVLLKLKGFPEEYFMYWEDVAFSFKARASGMKLAIIPDIKLSNPGESKPITDQKLYYLVRNGAYFLEKKAPLLIRPYWFIVNRLRLLFHSNKIIRQALKDSRCLPRP